MKVALSLVLALTTLFSAPAFARAGRTVLTAEQQEIFADQAVVSYVDCLMGNPKMRLLAEQYVRIPNDSQASVPIALRIRDERCVARRVVRLSYKTHLLFSNIFTALYARDYTKRIAPQVATAPALDIASEYDGDVSSLPALDMAMRTYGDCVARADPATLHHYLISGVRTPDNEAIFLKLQPAFEKCSAARGNLVFSRNKLRGVLAEALFKIRKSLDANRPSEAR